MSDMNLDIQFQIVLKRAIEMLTVDFHCDADLDRAEKIIGHCALYFSSCCRHVDKIENLDAINDKSVL
jgi:hypothetical protein